MRRHRGHEAPRGRQANQAERNVDQEDRPPIKIPEIGGHQQAAGDRTSNRGEASGEREKGEGEAALGRGKDDGNDGHHLRDHHRSGDPLSHASADQHLNVWCETAKRRTHSEGENAQQEHAAATDDVAKPTQGQQEKRKAQHIGRNHPFDLT